MPKNGICNGSGGVVVGIKDNKPIVQWEKNAITQEVQFETQAILSSSKKIIGHIEYMPLLLAYAVTCHRAQGQEWDRVILCLDPFAPNQAYTAVTRTKSLAGLKIVGHIQWKYFDVDEKILQFYQEKSSRQETLLKTSKTVKPQFFPRKIKAQCNNLKEFIPHNSIFASAICRTHKVPFLMTQRLKEGKESQYFSCLTNVSPCQFYLLPAQNLYNFNFNTNQLSLPSTFLEKAFCQYCGSSMHLENDDEILYSNCQLCDIKSCHQILF